MDSLEGILLNAFLLAGKEYARPSIPSEQMKELLNTYKVDESTGCINVPHYWAASLHDGRGPSPKDGPGVLVWFSNPANDPRLNAGRYPVTEGQVRHLTPEQFREGTKRNREVIEEYKKRVKRSILTKADYEKMKLYMIVAMRSPRDGGRVTKNYPFFSNDFGMKGFGDLANRMGSSIVSDHIFNRLKKAGVIDKTITHTIVLK